MQTTRTLTIGLISLALFTTSYAQASTTSDTSECPDIPNAQERGEQFRKQLVAIQENSSAVTVAELKAQLKRKQCAVSLQPPTTTELSPADLYEHRRDAVVVVGSLTKCGRCSKWHLSSASGFFIGEDGILVSNHHVIEKRDDDSVVGVMTYAGDVFPITEVLASDAKADVAIMRVEGKGFKTLRLAEGCRVGDPVWVLGHPRSRYYHLTDGMVSGFYERSDGATKMDITADFGLGSSGAPVFDAAGNVVGVASSTSPLIVKDTHNTAAADKGKTSKHQRPSHAQMIFKQCVPVDRLRALCK